MRRRFKQFKIDVLPFGWGPRCNTVWIENKSQSSFDTLEENRQSQLQKKFKTKKK